VAEPPPYLAPARFIAAFSPAHFLLVPVLSLPHCPAVFPLGDAPAKSPAIVAELPIGPLQSLVEISFGPSHVAKEITLGPTQGIPHPGVGERRATARLVDPDSTMIRSHDYACFDGRQAHRGVDQNCLPRDRGDMGGEENGNGLGSDDSSVHGSLR